MADLNIAGGSDGGQNGGGNGNEGNSNSGGSSNSGGNAGNNQQNQNQNTQRWQDSLPDDLKQEASIGAFKSVADMAKSYVHAQKMVGADKVIIPSEKAGEDDWNAFYKKLGRPESSDKYELDLPKDAPVDGEILKGLKDTAYKSGLNTKQLNTLMGWYTGASSEKIKAAQVEQQNKYNEEIKSYEEAVGGKDKLLVEVDKARRALRELGDDDLIKFLDESKMGSRAPIIKFFSKLADQMSEDKIRDKGGNRIGMGADEIQSKLDSIMASKAYFDGSHVEHDGLVKQAYALREQLHKMSKK